MRVDDRYVNKLYLQIFFKLASVLRCFKIVFQLNNPF